MRIWIQVHQGFVRFWRNQYGSQNQKRWTTWPHDWTKLIDWFRIKWIDFYIFIHLLLFKINIEKLQRETWVSHDWVMILVQVPKKWSRFFFHGKMKNSFEDRFFIKCCRMILDMWMKAWENHEWIFWKDFMPMESMNEMVKVWIAWWSKAKKNILEHT